MSDIHELNKQRRSHMTPKELADDDYKNAAAAEQRAADKSRIVKGHWFDMGSSLCSTFMSYNNPRAAMQGAIRFSLAAFKLAFMGAAEGADSLGEQALGKTAPGIMNASQPTLKAVPASSPGIVR